MTHTGRLLWTLVLYAVLIKGSSKAPTTRCGRLWKAYKAIPGGLGIGTSKQIKETTGIDINNRKQTKEIVCKIAKAKSVEQIARILRLPSARIKEYWSHATEQVHGILDKGLQGYLQESPDGNVEKSRAVFTFLRVAHEIGLFDLPVKDVEEDPAD